ncbi:Rieske (2Fe-2S) protein, partial [Cellulomonas shaoxiangyii]
AAAVGVLAACGGGTGADGPGTAAGGATAGPDGALASVDDVPVGGALLVTGPDGTPLLLTQPAAGTVVGLSAVCTHQGCTVVPGDEELECPCHRSVFTLEGEPVSGPATEPLPPFPVTVRDDGSIVAAGA